MALKARRATAALPRDLWTENLRQYKLLVKFIGVDMELAQNELIFYVNCIVIYRFN